MGAEPDSPSYSLKPLTPNSKYVKLNVGGSLHYTTLRTLTGQDTMLKAMFSGRVEVLTDAGGMRAAGTRAALQPPVHSRLARFLSFPYSVSLLSQSFTSAVTSAKHSIEVVVSSPFSSKKPRTSSPCKQQPSDNLYHFSLPSLLFAFPPYNRQQAAEPKDLCVLCLEHKFLQSRGIVCECRYVGEGCFGFTRDLSEGCRSWQVTLNLLRVLPLNLGPTCCSIALKERD